MYERILVGAAFDELGELAASQAQQLAQLCGAHVTLLHIIESIGDEPGDAELEEFYSALQAKAAERLRAMAARFEEVGVDASSEIRIGVRWKALLEYADDDDSDLIVLGSRVMDKENPQLGTTSHQVFFASSRHLLIVRA